MFEPADGGGVELRLSREERTLLTALAAELLELLGGTPTVASRRRLRALNDVRLVLGTRLDVQEDTLLDELGPDESRAQGLAVYGYLTWIQEQLVAALSPGA